MPAEAANAEAKKKKKPPASAPKATPTAVSAQPKPKAAASAAPKAAASAASTPSVALFNELMTDCPSSKGKGILGKATLAEAISSTETQLRDAARETGMLEYRSRYVDGAAKAAMDEEYIRMLAMMDDRLVQVDALYMYRRQKCFDEVQESRKAVVQKSKQIEEYKERIRSLSNPDFVSEDMVHIKKSCLT